MIICTEKRKKQTTTSLCHCPLSPCIFPFPFTKKKVMWRIYPIQTHAESYKSSELFYVVKELEENSSALLTLFPP